MFNELMIDWLIDIGINFLLKIVKFDVIYEWD